MKIFKGILILTVIGISYTSQAQTSCESVELKKEEYLKQEYSSSPNIQVIQNCGCKGSCVKKEEDVKIIYKDRVVYREAPVKVIYKDRVVYREAPAKVIYKDRVVYKDKVVYRDTVTPEEKVVYKPIYKTKVKKVYVDRFKDVAREKQRHHSVSLLGVFSKTNIQTKESDYNYMVGGIHEGEHNVEVKRSYEADIGLMYQYDADRIRLSIGGTLGGTGLLGIGFNF